ncbi:Alpha-glucosidase [Rubrivivax sp. A210]|uniref:glycoside hydrolase family 31 protein n=1 Tax=Rubrivivax sp. A210 TaxID=2772301 RepID=UPI00191A4F01|nr:glycoside hydrolase family 31 protein [Rubrivivax sp. A210]CAD5366062.1 Alpha-glucosidase [Rubrivivax sp. A210]
MYFQKIRHPSNFRFAEAHTSTALRLADSELPARVRDLGEDVFHVEIADAARWPLDARLLRLNEDEFDGPSGYRLGWGAGASLQLADAGGTILLEGLGGACFGVCGRAWLLQLARDDAMRFYGQGEKLTGLEKTGKRTKFWNLDVWADHPMPVVIDGQPDPQYAAIPYLLIRRGAHWVGILVDHPGSVFMDTGSNWFFSGRDDLQAPPSLWFGADEGVPAFYVIAGHSAAAVTQRLQRLVGKTPLPPLWALGHHQCRWGYRGPRDLQRLDRAFAAHEFPNDGLWLDIDYMEDYKVFTTSPAHFGDRAAELQALNDRGHRVVPILDPGVKVQQGYEVAASGQAAGIYCLNPEGAPYVGFVWPGRTWFPDFSLPEARVWWAGYARQFREWGFGGAWIDMNDPSTGAAEVDDMRFQRGAWPHWTYHNLYATGMAQATHEGFLAARPDERPFLLSRSAATGSSRWTAVWTGDNWSNWQHLRATIPCTLNLALSGIPFNGPDVPGFGGHASRELAIAWYKAGMLFPFLRNHAVAGSAQQEPWVFGDEALAIIRHHVRLRYKLLPYLYQLWIAQERDGTAVMRPLFHDFDNEDGQELDHIDDQFLVGPALMQAPLLHPGQQRRTVTLPGRGRWMDVSDGRFIRAGRSIQVTSNVASTPVFLREGQLIPMQPGARISQTNDLADIELHLILGAGCSDEAALDYAADDGLSYGYRRDERSLWRFTAWREGDVLHLEAAVLEAGWKPLRLCVVGYDGARSVVVTTATGTQTLTLVSEPWVFSGAPLAAGRSQAVSI